MFPELAGVLNEAYEMAFYRLEDPSATVSGPVVTRYRSASQNMRTTFGKIIERAGLIPWPKPFQNLRATWETELMETYPSHVVVSWIGHSEAVARKHYLQTTDLHFEKAEIRTPADLVASFDTVTATQTSDLVAIQVASETCEMMETEENTESNKDEPPLVFTTSADEFASLPEDQITRPGLEPGTTEPKSVVLPLHHRVTWTDA